MAINKKYLKVLMDINAEIPKELKDKLMIKVEKSPTIVKVLNLALLDPEISEEKKAKIRLVLETGDFTEEIEILDKEVEKEIDTWLGYEIDRAIKLGKLPEDRTLLGKLKKNGNKKHKTAVN